jgi:glycosyltransferase involved in cell wall biosynthesis
MFKLIHLTQTDGGAGAGRAAYRIHQSLLRLGLDSRMLVADKRTADPTVTGLKRGSMSRARLCEWIEARNGRRLAASQHNLFSPASFSQFDVAAHKELRGVDIVSLYWINGGFVSPEALARINKPLVWRLSDIWPFSGGCHYPGNCESYTSNCGNCPQLKHASAHDASRRLWERKSVAWRDLSLTIVAPSNWMARLARQSCLFGERRIEVVPTGVDLSVFRPLDKLAVRERLGIPPDQLVIAFGALDLYGDARKGFKELYNALEIIAVSPLASRVSTLIFGNKQLPHKKAPIPEHHLGYLDKDSALVDAYNAADLVLVPSLEDNLPNVALEAIACGIPVCGFDVAGMPDIVHNRWNGCLAPLRDSGALAKGIIAILSNDGLRRQMAVNARIHAEQSFSIDIQARVYAQLYASILDKKSTT